MSNVTIAELIVEPVGAQVKRYTNLTLDVYDLPAGRYDLVLRQPRASNANAALAQQAATSAPDAQALTGSEIYDALVEHCDGNGICIEPEVIDDLSDYLARFLAQQAATPAEAASEPLFWYRPRSDGGYEGPIHNSSIERVRKGSGGWVPLCALAEQPVAAVTDEIRSVLMAVRANGYACYLASGAKSSQEFMNRIDAILATQQPAKSAEVPTGKREADARIHAVADGLFAYQRIGDKVPSMDRDDFREIIGAAIAGWSVQQVQADAGEREALQHVVDCWEAAEVEGLQQALSDARAYSQNTTAGRLADFLNRRISHGIERARAILRATNDTGASNGN